VSASHDIRPAVPADLAAVATLLHTVSLPSDDIAPSLDGFFVATIGHAVIGTIGIERYGDAALLRSVATSARARGTGIGAALVQRAIESAKAAGITDLYLLTTTAAEWAPRFGFAPIARDRVLEAVRQSPQFMGGTCSSAAAMHRALID
jgi:amino-acid N-acetyltransferase